MAVRRGCSGGAGIAHPPLKAVSGRAARGCSGSAEQ